VVKLITAVRVPVAPGVKVTRMVQLCPELSVNPVEVLQVPPAAIAKSPMSVPAMTAPDAPTGIDAVSVTVTVSALLVVEVDWLGKLSIPVVTFTSPTWPVATVSPMKIEPSVSTPSTSQRNNLMRLSRVTSDG